MALARYSNNETQICYPSIKNLMNKTNLTNQTIQTSIKHLENNQYIEVDRSFGNVNFYQLNQPPKRFDMSKITPATILKEHLLPPKNNTTNNTNIKKTNITLTEQSSVTHKKTNSSLKRNKKVTSNKKPKQGVQQHTQTSGTPAGDIDVAWNTHAKLYQYINELDADGQKIDTLGAKKFKILAYYAILAKQKILNKVQWESFVNRNIKVVSRLIEQEWSCKQICLTSFLLEAKNLSWSLESIEKWIPRLDSELAKQTSEEEGKYAELFRELKDNIIKLNNQFKK